MFATPVLGTSYSFTNSFNQHPLCQVLYWAHGDKQDGIYALKELMAVWGGRPTHRSFHGTVKCPVVAMSVSVRDSARKDFPEKVPSLLGLKDCTGSRWERCSSSKWKQHKQMHASGRLC